MTREERDELSTCLRAASRALDLAAAKLSDAPDDEDEREASARTLYAMGLIAMGQAGANAAAHDLVQRWEP